MFHLTFLYLFISVTYCGTIQTISGCVYCDGYGSVAQFLCPFGIGLDRVIQRLYVTDTNTVRRIDINTSNSINFLLYSLSTEKVDTICGQRTNPGNQDGNCNSASFQFAEQIPPNYQDTEVDSNGNVYVLDGEVGAMKIRKITPSGSFRYTPMNE